MGHTRIIIDSKRHLKHEAADEPNDPGVFYLRKGNDLLSTRAKKAEGTGGYEQEDNDDETNSDRFGTCGSHRNL